MQIMYIIKMMIHVCIYIYIYYMHDYAYTCCHTHQVPSYPSNECAPEVITATAQEEVFQSLQIDLYKLLLYWGMLISA